jgi:molybdate/tungstate transport system substrate-binding protein
MISVQKYDRNGSFTNVSENEMSWKRRSVLAALCGLFAILLLPAAKAAAAGREPLQILAAGTLARPFREIDALFRRRYPNVVPQPQFGGSVKMAREIAELHEPADILAVADYSVIPKYLFASGSRAAYATWYAGFARNAITFVYTPKSKDAGRISLENWYRVLARPHVEIGRSNPDTDPSGYQTLQMLSLAEKYYRAPGLAMRVLENAPKTNMRDTETSLISALELGEIDYLAIYRSDALQHHFRYLALPAKIDLSDPADAAFYKTGVAHTKNGAIAGRPIVYAATIVKGARHPGWAAKYLAFLFGPEGQKVMRKNGFLTLSPAIAKNVGAVPAALRSLLKPWPGS